MPAHRLIVCRSASERFLKASGHKLTEQRVLTSGGRRHALHLGHALLGSGVSSNAIILSSSDQASIATSREIQDCLALSDTMRPQIYSSDLVHEAGDYPQAVRSLRHLVDTALAASKVKLGRHDMVMVTQQPLVEALAGNHDIPDTALVPLDLSWINPNFSPILQRRVLPELTEA